MLITVYSYVYSVLTPQRQKCKALSIRSRCAICHIFGIWHTKPQNMSLLRCFKCQNFLHTTIVPSQIWDDMDNNCKWVYYYFYSAFSLIPIKISLHLHRLIYALSLTSLFNHFFALPPSTPRHCRPLRRNLGRSIKLGRSLLLWFFFFAMIWYKVKQWVG